MLHIVCSRFVSADIEQFRTLPADAYVIATAVDWNFGSGIPHGIQGVGGCFALLMPTCTGTGALAQESSEATYAKLHSAVLPGNAG